MKLHRVQVSVLAVTLVTYISRLHTCANRHILPTLDLRQKISMTSILLTENKQCTTVHADQTISVG